MSKKFLAALLVSAALLSACGGVASPSGEKPAQSPASEAAPAALPFEVVTEPGWPEPVKAWVQANRTSKNSTVIDTGTAIYLVVAAGERPTGGYSVKFQQVERRGSSVVANAVVQAPAPGSMVTMALTYPVGVVKVNVTGLSAQINVTHQQP